MKASKASIRSKHRTRRDAMDHALVMKLSREIADRVLALAAVRDARSWFVYVSRGNEVNTHDLIEALLNRACNVAVPLVVEEQIVARQIDSLDKLQLGAWGIPEPPPGEPFLGPIDVCICPGLAFTERGERLGVGGGYYDRYIATHAPRLTVGLAFEWQVVRELPHLAHDQAVEVVVTEKRTLFRRTGGSTT